MEALAFYLAKKEASFKASKKSRLRFSYFKTKRYVAVSCVPLETLRHGSASASCL